MLNGNLQSVIETIQEATNPEIYHFRRGSHPGQKYYIKTIIPGPKIINDDTYVFWQFWETLAKKYPRIIKLVDCAYDWSGKTIANWWTIWLEERIDIVWSWSRTDGIDFHLIDYDIGIKYSGLKAIEILSDTVDRQSPEDIVSLSQLQEIADFLYHYTSERMAEINRKKIHIVETDHVQHKTNY